MGSIAVRCGSNRRILRFYVASLLEDSCPALERGIEFSKDSNDKDWEWLSDSGLSKMIRLKDVLTGRNDYALVFDGYVEINLYSLRDWLSVFPKVITILAGEMKTDPLRVVVASDCERKQKPWVEELIACLY